MLGGIPVIYGINPFSTETVPQHQLGAIGVTPDGRKFRYALVGSGSALVAGNLLQSSAEDTASQNLAPASAAAVGAFSVDVASATVTANQFANGYMVITQTAGNGRIYRIKSHPAGTAATVTFQLYDPIETALVVATTNLDLVANPFSGVIQWPASETGAPVGVAFVAAAVSTYTWIQTGGACAVLAQGTVSVGENVSASAGTAAAIETATAGRPTVGAALTGIASTDNGCVFLRMD